MADRVYPSSKPNGTTANAAANHHPTATTTTTNPPQFPPAKSHLYNPTRHPYRPNPALHARHNHRRCSCRRCFCLCCFWSILIFLIVLLLVAIAGAVFYVLYRPHRPDFSLSSLKISQFNLSTTSDDVTRLTTQLNLTLSSKNTNKKITFSYNPITINLFSGQQKVLLSNGTFSNFTSQPGDVTIIHSVLSMNSQVLDADSVTSLRSDLKRKNGLPMEMEMETKVKVKMEKLKSKKIGIKIVCDGIHGMIPKGKTPAVASTSNAKCKVDLQIKIWKFNF
ncbi:hypothetical protein ACH5RR_041360 [Cinchona calisaya]|uniref:Late embryogenesis abundant protein LEA-2 subgroup domain-containing protein n=1 Tax=Cinchona calisaya TaxID=153742 RepID=A0ABD2XU49_9GENT